jgi:hypothetical protein
MHLLLLIARQLRYQLSSAQLLGRGVMECLNVLEGEFLVSLICVFKGLFNMLLNFLGFLDMICKQAQVTAFKINFTKFENLQRLLDGIINAFCSIRITPLTSLYSSSCKQKENLAKWLISSIKQSNQISLCK